MAQSSFESLKNKLAILADAAKYDASCSSSGSQRKRQAGGMGNVEGMGICHSYAPDGRCISLLKILMTNYCIYDCKFCVNRVSSDTPRARFTPAEIVWLTLEFYRRNYIEGLFLSSGIIGSSDQTMELLIEVARSLRQDHKFNGYIHLKVVAGSSPELTERAGLFADRISVNIEMPVQTDLDRLAPAKTLVEAQGSMLDIKGKLDQTKDEQKHYKKTPLFAPAGQTTQMIVGATGTDDASFLNKTETLYKDYRLKRVYYSAYSPIVGADPTLPSGSPVLRRENRLYQADWLMRFYGFAANELANESAPSLSEDIDPKTAWALRNRHFFPVDVNKASKEELLRVPGFGVRGVERILMVRRLRRLRVQDLKTLRLTWARARFFVSTTDHNPDALLIDRQNLDSILRPGQQQLSLFDAPANSAGEAPAPEALDPNAPVTETKSTPADAEAKIVALTGEM